MTDQAILVGMLLSLGVFYMASGCPAILVGWAAFFALTLYRQQLSLVMVPLAAPLFYRPRVFPGDKYLPLVEVIILIGIAAWAVRDAWAWWRKPTKTLDLSI